MTKSKQTKMITQKPKPWSRVGRVQQAIAEGKMAASMRLPPAPQLEISRTLLLKLAPIGY